MASMATKPPSTSKPNGVAIAKKSHAWKNAKPNAPAKRPTRIEVREVGAATSRSKNPSSMSRAIPAPATIDPKRVPCTTVVVNWN
jgi:hypothetical protein